uniref:Uncharacterized protein n=1 Tax=Trichinella nativa TaxID=6335 RepID=A0A0V1KIC5_9BILA
MHHHCLAPQKAQQQHAGRHDAGEGAESSAS